MAKPSIANFSVTCQPPVDDDEDDDDLYENVYSRFCEKERKEKQMRKVDEESKSVLSPRGTVCSAPASREVASPTPSSTSHNSQLLNGYRRDLNCSFFVSSSNRHEVATTSGNRHPTDSIDNPVNCSKMKSASSVGNGVLQRNSSDEPSPKKNFVPSASVNCSVSSVEGSDCANTEDDMDPDLPFVSCRVFIQPNDLDQNPVRHRVKMFALADNTLFLLSSTLFQDESFKALFREVAKKLDCGPHELTVEKSLRFKNFDFDFDIVRASDTPNTLRLPEYRFVVLEASCNKSKIVGLSIKLQFSSGKKETRTLQKDETFGKLKKMLASERGIKAESISLRFDNEALNDEQTPQSLDMETDDLIDVHI